MSEAAPGMMKLTVTEDLPTCPQCGNPAVKIDDRHRNCNTCGLTWERLTAEDELDDAAERLIRSRGWNEEHGKTEKIGRFPRRW